MLISMKAININDFNTTVEVKFIPPKQCPVCEISSNKNEKLALIFPTQNSDMDKLAVVFFCTACDTLYVAEYFIRKDRRNYIGTTAQPETPISIYPYPESSIDFNENIKEVSPNFVKIYKQSLLAENNNLKEICGMGYRKSLEFLIKDYSIYLLPQDKDKISKMSLSQVIDSYIDNKRIKSLAKASAWIGNDETHYQRKHEDYNVSHLKSFIHSVVTFIDSDIEAIKADQLINSHKNN